MIDGGTGLVVEPDADDLRAHRQRSDEAKRERKQLNRLRREPSCTGRHPTSSCGRTRNRARREPRRITLARPAWACTKPIPCSRAAARSRTRTPSSAPTAMPCSRHDRAHGDHPHPRPRRRQGRQDRPRIARRTQPCARPAAWDRRWPATACTRSWWAIARASGYGRCALVPMISGAEEMHGARDVAHGVGRSASRGPRGRRATAAGRDDRGAARRRCRYRASSAPADFHVPSAPTTRCSTARRRPQQRGAGRVVRRRIPPLLRLGCGRRGAYRATARAAGGGLGKSGDAAFVPLLLALGSDRNSACTRPLRSTARSAAATCRPVCATKPMMLRACDRAGIERWLSADHAKRYLTGAYGWASIASANR